MQHEVNANLLCKWIQIHQAARGAPHDPVKPALLPALSSPHCRRIVAGNRNRRCRDPTARDRWMSGSCALSWTAWDPLKV
jgi:hypothetical protein